MFLFTFSSHFFSSLLSLSQLVNCVKSLLRSLTGGKKLEWLRNVYFRMAYIRLRCPHYFPRFTSRFVPRIKKNCHKSTEFSFFPYFFTNPNKPYLHKKAAGKSTREQRNRGEGERTTCWAEIVAPSELWNWLNRSQINIFPLPSLCIFVHVLSLEENYVLDMFHM